MLHSIQSTNVSHVGVRRNFSRGEQRRHFAYHFSGCERCNANGLSQNALSCLDHKETSPWRQALHSHLFEIVFRWSCIRVCEKVVLFCHPLQFGWIGVAYHPIPLLLWTTDNWAWIGLEIATTALAVLTLVCVDWSSLLKI